MTAVADAATKENLDFNPDAQAMNLSEVKHVIVNKFLGALERGERPSATHLWGPPGEGKTEITYAATRAIARELNKQVLGRAIAAGSTEPYHIAGLPEKVMLPNAEGVMEPMFFRNLGSEWAWEMSEEYERYEQSKNPKFEAPPMIVLLDDITTAHDQTQAAFFKGVHERLWGSCHQRRNVMIVSAGNRDIDNAGAHEMLTALGSRLDQLHVLNDVDDWLAWAAGFREEGEEGVKGEPRIHFMVQGNIRSRPHTFREFNEDIANRAERTFACARTWESVSRLLYQGRIGLNDPTFDRVVQGIIGQGQAIEFSAFIRNAHDLVPPADIIAAPTKAEVPDKRNMDRLHATVCALESEIQRHPEYWSPGLIYAVRKEIVPDIGFLLAKTVSDTIRTRLEGQERANAQCSDEMRDVWKRYPELLEGIDV